MRTLRSSSESLVPPTATSSLPTSVPEILSCLDDCHYLRAIRCIRLRSVFTLTELSTIVLLCRSSTCAHVPARLAENTDGQAPHILHQPILNFLRCSIAGRIVSRKRTYFEIHRYVYIYRGSLCLHRERTEARAGQEAALER